MPESLPRRGAGPWLGESFVLAVNAGSSTLKFGLYGRGGPARWTGQFEGLEPGGSMRGALNGQPLAVQALAGSETQGIDAALALLVGLLQREARSPLVAVAHRIVHGGDRFTAPCMLDTCALDELARLNPLAPLHQPHNLTGVAAFARAFPGVPQVGCFDTAFHATLPPLERRLPLPASLAEAGVRRYGFHGLSYEYLVGELRSLAPRALGGRALLAHLGNGASVCATLAGRSVATSMGFSALDGLMMGTRCGSLDPGVLLHLWREGWSLDRVERLLYRESGLKGVSGLAADMRTLRASSDPRAAEAIALFTQRLRREIGALWGQLGGLDLVAFTGGIGEHDARLRAESLVPLGALGLRLDARANVAATGSAAVPIHAADSTIEVWVVPTDEGRVAARSAWAVLRAAT